MSLGRGGFGETELVVEVTKGKGEKGRSQVEEGKEDTMERLDATI